MAGVVWGSKAVLAIAKLGPFNTEQDARKAQGEVLHLRPETAQLLSSDQLRAQIVIASRLEYGNWFKGVLCIDCLDPSLIPGPEDQRFWTEVLRLAASIVPFVPPTRPPRVAVRSVQAVEGAELKEMMLEPVSV